MGGLRATSAAQAWHGWRTNYLDCVVEVHNEPDRLAAERRAIYGGRNECYRVGKAIANVCEVDATAHYPSIASANALPGRVARGERFDRLNPVDIARAGYLVIAEGELWTEEPVLPLRKDGRTVYPTGHWHGTYCWPEWDLLIRTGGKVRFRRWWVYEPCDPFSRYFAALHQRRGSARNGGQAGQATAIKLLMNGLVGKLCSQDKRWVDCPDLFYPEPWHAWQQVADDGQSLERYRTIAWRVQREETLGEGCETIPALAAWIYSLGRVRLWEWMSIASREEVFYADTDSLWTSQAGLDRIRAVVPMDNGELGSLRHVDTHQWARFFGHKHYETPDGVVCAGVPRNGLLRTDNGWTYWTADTPGQAARRSQAPTAELIRHTVSDRVSYQGGKIGGDGSVYPLEVNEDG